MSKAKVLFIDDDVMLGNIVTMALTEEGYVVHQQNSLTGIKAVVGEFRPSIIVMDVEVGAEDGIDVMPELYAVSPEIPIIVISSHSESNEVVRALQNGAVAYLKKPFETEELTAYIKRHTNVTHNFISRIKIASLELDTQSHILYQDIQKLKKLSKLEFALLILLYDHQGEIVSHDEISKLWGGAVMENHSLYNLIAKLRKVLSVDTRIEIVTVGKDGYALKIEDVASCI